jgi:hypothetical protein
VLELAWCSPWERRRGGGEEQRGDRKREQPENKREKQRETEFRGKIVQSVDTLLNNPLNGILSVIQCLKMT